MLFNLIVLFILVGFICVEIGMRTKFNFVFFSLSALLLGIAGILILTTGIEIESGTMITTLSTTVVNVTKNITIYNTGLYRSFGLIFIGLSAYLFINAAVQLRGENEE